MKRAVPALFLVVAFCAMTISRASAEKNVIVARTAPDVVLVWKVNDELTAETQRHVAGDELQRAIVARAVDVMTKSLPAEATVRENVTLKFVYFNNGGFDPNYKIETVSGIRRVGEISTTAGELRRSAAAWKARIAKGNIPAELHATFADDAFAGAGP